jgi:hypothetical protein
MVGTTDSNGQDVSKTKPFSMMGSSISNKDHPCYFAYRESSANVGGTACCLSTNTGNIVAAWRSLSCHLLL